MSRSSLPGFLALLAALTLSDVAAAQTAQGQTKTRHFLQPRAARPHTSHRSPVHHRQAHGTVTHGTPIHGTMAGPRM